MVRKVKCECDKVKLNDYIVKSSDIVREWQYMRENEKEQTVSI